MVAGLAEHEATVATLREHLADRNQKLAENEGESDPGRVAELEAQLESGQARVTELEAQLQQAELQHAELAATAVESESSEASDGRVAELEAQLNTLQEELADRDRQLAERPAEHDPSTTELRALVENVEHEAMAGLREDVADRDRRLAENVNELARLNRELAESAEREAAMTSLRSELADRDRQLSERAMLVENVEHDAMAALRAGPQRPRAADRADKRGARRPRPAAGRDRRRDRADQQRPRGDDDPVARGPRRPRATAGRESRRARAATGQGQRSLQSVDEEQTHVLFIPTQSGYSLLERPGPAPAVGATVEVEGDSENAGHFVVCKHGRPVPGGPRCAYVERV